MRRYLIGLTCGVMVVFLLWGVIRGERLSGIPDAVNSINSNDNVYLSVIANDRDIEDKEALAVKIVDMCRNNEFETIKFSYDYYYPKSLSISVFATHKGFENNEELFHIDYEMEDRLQPYNIVEHPEQYQLYVDGKIIEYSYSGD